MNQDFSDELEQGDADDETALSSPTRAKKPAHPRSSSTRDASPLRDITTRNASTPASRPAKEKQRTSNAALFRSIENEYQATDADGDEMQDEEPELFVDAAMDADDYDGEPTDHEEIEMEPEIASVEPPAEIDDEEADQTFSLQSQDGKGKTTANSRRKRKSDGDASVSAAKKPRKEPSKNGPKQPSNRESEPDASSAMPPPRARGRPPLKKKDNNSRMSKRQEKELEEVVEKVRARPNPPRSLYVLRKETPADDSVTLTRSGRMSVKPLAYWRNERCVWGGSPQTELKNGTRFPLNSIKEIIRTEEHYSPAARKARKARKGKGKARIKTEDDAEDELEVVSDDDSVEHWEIDSGTVRGTISEWDSEQGAPLDVEQEIDIAHSRQAIQTYVPAAKNGKETPTFKYSKLFSNEFMSVGLVDLPPGGIKKPKNAQKMQMTFYVVKGRVTASVGPVLGDMTTFSIGTGGFWQVPRGEPDELVLRCASTNASTGNQYSIENEVGVEARLVFCQGCEVIPEAFLAEMEE